ncbi:4Fe-4S dicluster domain-containing protein [Carboxylicivirga mesophila]|uniref:4Fe-4S dicluster domain-containing protein n=1 Tax=Carboxylicivirga mesophila TaxID=1166478 RepID=A0ABS5K5T0_9BACT|nr:4Fe-4S dicluster domain-containing protein [Carboxylicivirga mesophila]MBS2210334.1 4Fe-4S dicluster domain-containing protein [Carboxylicivirga mesophila]
MNQLVFTIILIAAIAVLLRSFWQIRANFALTRDVAFDGQVMKRLRLTAKVALGQTKILRKPFIGLMHALVFWGFIVITIGSLEMVIDGVSGWHRSLSIVGPLYTVIAASGDIFAYVVLAGIILFLARRLLMHIRRFEGAELTNANKTDAAIALGFIMLLMLSLIGLNMTDLYLHGSELPGAYPVSASLLPYFDLSTVNAEVMYSFYWWTHILLIFIFANYLPYSKHFHVFMSLPNVFFSNLNPLTYLPSMPEVQKEVALMLSGNAYDAAPPEQPRRFGVKDVEDITWKNYMDALTCTQCGRCTEVCPANITGKLLSPRKLFVDIRARMDEKSKNGSGHFLLGDYISKEELWACTTCNACAQECPLNISHPNLIMDMRRYLVLEEGDAPDELNAMFANIENNGAPWKYSAEDRLKWTEA